MDYDILNSPRFNSVYPMIDHSHMNLSNDLMPWSNKRNLMSPVINRRQNSIVENVDILSFLKFQSHKELKTKDNIIKLNKKWLFIKILSLSLRSIVVSLVDPHCAVDSPREAQRGNVAYEASDERERQGHEAHVACVGGRVCWKERGGGGVRGVSARLALRGAASTRRTRGGSGHAPK